MCMTGIYAPHGLARPGGTTDSNHPRNESYTCSNWPAIVSIPRATVGIMNAADALNANDMTAHALRWDPSDGTLSSGEGALARIVHAIARDADLLDGAQLAAVSQALAHYGDHVQGEEAKALSLLLSHSR